MMIDSQQLLDNLVTSVVLLDARLRLCYINQSAEMLFGVSQRQAEGMRLTDLSGGVHRMQSGVRRCLVTGNPYTEHELTLVFSAENTVTVDATVTPLGETGDPPTREAALMIELRQVDQHLKISRDEQLLAQQQTSKMLIRNLAHEIKNPLGGLRGAAQLLERELHEAELKEYTRIIIGEADRLSNLVDRMLGPNKPPVWRLLSIHEVLERVRTLVLAENVAGVCVEQDYDPSIPPLTGDAEQLIQAVLNIVRNAVQALAGRPAGKAAPEPGRIILRTRVRRQGTIALKRHKLVLQVDIIDNGPGIPDTLREDIFFPTISGNGEGTGLGLSIAQSIIGLHDGCIEYVSRPGHTVFTILLPLETVRNDD